MEHSQINRLPGFFVFAHDWAVSLGPCSANAERLFMRLCIQTSTQTEIYGVLKFNDGLDWRSLSHLLPGGSLFGIPLRDRKHLGSLAGPAGRPRQNQNADKMRIKCGLNADKMRIIRIFRALEKRVHLHRDVIARGFVELASKNVFDVDSNSCVSINFIVRQGIKREQGRNRVEKFRRKATDVTRNPILFNNTPYSPPRGTGPVSVAASETKTPAPRLRKSELRRRAAMHVGAETGGTKSPAKVFMELWQQSKRDSDQQSDNWQKISAQYDWFEISADRWEGIMRRWIDGSGARRSKI